MWKWGTETFVVYISLLKDISAVEELKEYNFILKAQERTGNENLPKLIGKQAARFIYGELLY